MRRSVSIASHHKSIISIYKYYLRWYHTPVYLQECCDYLNIEKGKVFVDCTLGGGGHTKEILSRGGSVIAIDRDLDAINRANVNLKEYIDCGRLEIVLDNFSNIKSIVKSSKLAKNGVVQGVLADLGVSSHQIDEPRRGFAFRFNGPLDMRMGQTTATATTATATTATKTPSSSTTTEKSISEPNLTAADIVNKWTLTDIANAIYKYGEEPMSRQIAREIVSSRPLRTTKDLTDAIDRVVSSSQRVKCYARCFQALRIVVNKEMESLEQLVRDIGVVMEPKGRFVALSYHSLEDRFIKTMSKSREIERGTGTGTGVWKSIYKQMKPPKEELDHNSRSRSAKMRVLERQ